MRVEKRIEQALPLMCDPVTREPLSYDEARGCLRSGSGETYPIVGGIPSFIEESGVEGLNLKYQKLYDRVARIYDLPYRLMQVSSRSRYTSLLMEYLGEVETSDGDLVLEVSIGTGKNLPFLNRDARYYGLDLSRGMLDRCRRNLKRWGLEATLFHGEAEHLPFRDDAFDVVFHVGGINFFSDKRLGIEEMYRVAKPGTKLVIVDENEKHLKTYQKLPVLRKAFESDGPPVGPPMDLVPADAIEVKTKNVWNERLYCMTFRKPKA